MNIYHYDAKTGEYLGVGVADESPLEPGVWHIPAYATSTPPPLPAASAFRVFRGGKWSYAISPLDPNETPSEEPPEFLPLPRLDFWLAAKSIGVFKADILAEVAQIGNAEEREEARIYIEEALQYRRDDPYLNMFATSHQLPAEQLDALWHWAGG